VGFYRSFTGREARVEEADQELMRTFFPHRHFACLLLQPLSREECAAGFQFWSEGKTLAEPAYAPFPFEAAQMKQETDAMPVGAGAAAPLPDYAGATEAQPSGIPRETRQAAAVPYMQPAPTGVTHSRILLPLLIWILVATAAIAIFELWRVTRGPRWVELHLDARPSARDLQLSWDATAPAIAQATRAVLAVTDGDTPVEIHMGPEQLHRGSFSYAYAHGDVLFQLRLYQKENPLAADSLRVLSLPKPAPAPLAAAAPENPRSTVLSATPAAMPPAVLHEVQPLISPGIRSRILTRTVVPVVVTVNESGRVTRASSKVGGHGLERYLADQAVKAARHWSFSPARSKQGSPVPGSKTISFEFTPAGQ
jgi:TonB family protein